MADVVSGDLVVAVDFGTTNTVAVARREGQAPQVVSVDGAPSLPSAVLLADDGRLVVGTDALRLGRSAPHRLEQRPKARLGEDTILLGDTPVAVLAAVRAVLARVCTAAAQQAGTPVAHLVLTHPADWGPVRLGRLPRAAAGLAPRLSLVPEPVAVAARTSLPAGAATLVVDLGGGTCDAAVVRRDGTGYTVAACAGLPDLGGDDLDQRIVDWLDPEPDATATDVPTLRTRLLLRQDARATKELLSRHDIAPIQTDSLSRAKFEELVADDLTRVVDLAARVVESSGVARDALRGVHLVGGTSRIPRVTESLREALDLPVHPDPEPEAAVAWGALDLVGANDAATPTRPVHPQPVAEPVAAQPKRRVVALGLVTAVAAGAVVVTGAVLGNEAVDGTAVAASIPPPPSTSTPESTTPQWDTGIPAALPGKPVLGPAGPKPAVVAAGRSGIFRATYPGEPETRVEVELARGEVADRAAPDGYRWVVGSVHATLRGPGELQAGDGHHVLLVDDRGELVDSVGRASADTVALCGSNQQNLPATPKDKTRTECAAFLVPAATAVRGVLFDDRVIDPSRTRGLLFPVDLPASGPASLPLGEQQVGGAPLALTDDSGERAEAVVADVIDTPSAYVTGPKPPPGTRLLVLRYALRANGIGSIQPSGIGWDLQVLDDRGLPIPAEAYLHLKVRDCPEPPDDLPVGAIVKGCLVFVVATGTKLSRVVYRTSANDSTPANWRVWEFPG